MVNNKFGKAIKRRGKGVAKLIKKDARLLSKGVKQSNRKTTGRLVKKRRRRK